MARYVDGYVLVVPRAGLTKYKKMAKEAGEMWIKYGALSVFECVEDDLNPDMGGFETLTFAELVKPKKGELILFSFIVYKSRAQRDRVNKKINQEMEKMHKDDPDHMKKMPFDMKRMAYGGFKALVSLSKKNSNRRR